MDPWTLRVAELNIQYYECLLSEGLPLAKVVVVRRLLAAEKATLARLRKEQRSGGTMKLRPRAASASD
jgi:hypothetical protein